jgi:hypothetical protein
MPQDFSQLLSTLVNKGGTVSSATQTIDDLHQFIFNNIPYGLVDPKNLQQGLIELDGPNCTNPPRAQPLLQWHFGGIPYPIAKAIRIQYTYTRMYQDNRYDESGSLFIGYDLGGTPPANPTAPKNWSTTPIGNIGQFLSALETFASENSVARIAAKVDDLDAFIKKNNPLSAHHHAAGNVATVYYDGPAQRYDSNNPFPYTRTTLFNDQDRYGELLHWYFGGKAYQVTKAIRVSYPSQPVTLFIGYQGPGGQP